ncbi:MAG: M28 family peptidase [Flavobacteriaceae bacterium]|nr:M28 family peptidase [Flavobacteriaceae bacterium]
MRKIIMLGLVATLMACGSAKVRETSPEDIVNGPEGVKGSIGSPETDPTTNTSSTPVYLYSNEIRMSALMNFMASDDLQGRDSGSDGIEKAASYIEESFEENNIRPYFESFRDTLANFKPTSYNVVGWIPGNDPELKDEFIVIGAHYDHIGIVNSTNGDAIANGANDNASGTSTVMELARYFGNAKTNKRSLIFALFSAEERGLMGSWHLAKKLKESNLNLYTMLNFEMTGVPMVGKDYFLYITGYDKSNLAEVSNEHAGENLIGLLPTAQELNLFQRSDNYPFHEVFGVPAHTYCTFDFTNFDHYHGVDDEPQIMDFDHMAEVVNRIIPVIEGITNAAEQEVITN